MAIWKSVWGGYHSGEYQNHDVELLRRADIHEVVAHIDAEQEKNLDTGNPYGYTEIHAWHVWEVLHALEALTPDGRDKKSWKLIHDRS